MTLLAIHALSSAIFGFALTLYPGAGPVVGALSGAVVFLCLRHIYDTLSHARDKREIAEDLRFICSANLSVRGALDDTRRRLTEITSALAKRAELHERKVASELQLLQQSLRESPRTATAKTGESAAPTATPHYARTLADQQMLDLIRRSLEENRVEEKTVVQLLEFNIGHGQGFLFGEPKPIRDVGEINDPRVKEATATAAVRTAPGLARRLAG